MKTSERIAELTKQRNAKVSAMQELVEKGSTENRVLSDDESGVFGELKKDIGTLDRDLDSLREMETILAKHAQLAGVGGPRITGGEPRIEKGIMFARYVQAVAFTRGDMSQAVEIAKSRWGETPQIEQMLRAQGMGLFRAAVPVGTTTDPAWAGALAAATQISGEMIELVMADAVLGRLPNLRKVPFNVRLARETVAMGTAQWVGQGMSKPVGKSAFDFITMPFTKAALITIITEELARFSNPSAEGELRDQLKDAITTFLDTEFLNPASAPVANISPGGITNGLAAGQSFASSGDTAEHVRYDAQLAVSKLNGGKGAKAPVWIFNPTTFAWIAGMQNGMGTPAFPSTNGAAPTLLNIPVVTSANEPADTYTLLDQRMILVASDSGVTVDVSREASVQADSAPATPPAGMISLWQQNLIGLRAEQFIHWLRARNDAVVLVTGVGYGSTPPALFAAPGGQGASPAQQSGSGSARARQAS